MLNVEQIFGATLVGEFEDRITPKMSKLEAELNAGATRTAANMQRQMTAIDASGRSIQGSFTAIGGAMRALDTQGTFSRTISEFSMAEAQVQNVVLQVQALKSSFMQVGPAMLGSIGAIGAVTAAVYLLTKQFQEYQELQAKAEAELQKNQWKIRAEDVANLYQANQAILKQYEELSQKANRTAVEEQQLSDLRKAMRYQSWNYDMKLDYGNYGAVVGAMASDLARMYEANDRAILDNQRKLSAARTLEERASYQKEIEMLREAQEHIKKQFESTEKEIKKTTAGPDKAAALRQEQAELNRIILDAQRERMTREQQLASAYEEQLAGIDALRLASVAERERAIYEVTVSYNDKVRALAEKTESEWRASYDRMRQYELSKWDQQIRLAEQQGPKLLAQLRDLNAKREDEQKRLREHENLMRQLDASGQALDIQMNPMIPEEQKSYLIEQVRLLAEKANLEAQIQYSVSVNDQFGALENAGRLANVNKQLTAVQTGMASAQKESKTFKAALQTTGQAVEQAFLSAAQAALMSGENLAKAISDQMKAVGVQEAILAVVELAKYFGSMWLNPAEAASHLASSKLHAAAAAMIGAIGGAAGAAAGGGGGGEGGGEGGAQSGPREYTAADLARIQAGGAAPGAGGGGGLERYGGPLVAQNIQVNAMDLRDAVKTLDKSKDRLARNQVKAMLRSGAISQMIGEISSGVY